MILPISISLVLVALTIVIHGVGSTWWIKYLARKYHIGMPGKAESDKGLYILSYTAIFLLLLHFTEILAWAVVYRMIPDITQLTSLEEATYFSMVTYATLGYGDITLGPHWRIMSGFEAMDGILLFGWSTALFFSAVQRIIRHKISEGSEEEK
jgi:voltage-gated potassium channel